MKLKEDVQNAVKKAALTACKGPWKEDDDLFSREESRSHRSGGGA